MRQLIMIEFLSGVLYRTKLLDSNIPEKDLIIGFEINKKLKKCLLILMEGITFLV